jgi:hypothetical protein
MGVMGMMIWIMLFWLLGLRRGKGGRLRTRGEYRGGKVGMGGLKMGILVGFAKWGYIRCRLLGRDMKSMWVGKWKKYVLYHEFIIAFI